MYIQANRLSIETINPIINDDYSIHTHMNDYLNYLSIAEEDMSSYFLLSQIVTEVLPEKSVMKAINLVYFTNGENYKIKLSGFIPISNSNI